MQLIDVHVRKLLKLEGEEMPTELRFILKQLAKSG